MKQLGTKINIPERQADVRISQYESDHKTPRKDIIEKLANILDVNEFALDTPDLTTNYGAIFTMFEYYYTYGLHPVKIDGKIYLELDKNIADSSFIKDINEWYDTYESFQSGDITKEQFIDWMLKYPEYSKNYANPLPREKWLSK
ncbi:helix-turn-helix domain-containing protein [[Clostridium] innocuum]|nr:helix-turn-helix domain-containing protein [[Clostridium] innocuum]MCR0162703.1 helix-turn-helix domain-containing protein [[Clostridium] innocuum]MCR0485444.1 helix-turn-helix domain-containing protein [[Clostridium] innocuum]